MEKKAQAPNNRGCLFCPNHELGWHYQDVGHGRPLILLHGIGMSHVAWKNVIMNLANERRVLAFESANGARYKSQGQARSKAERVAPGYRETTTTRPEGPKYIDIPPGAFGAGIRKC